MSAVTAVQNQDSIRYSTYSGAPSLHPSIAPTMDSNRSQQVDSARNTMNDTPAELNEKKPASVARSPSAASSAVDARSAELKEWAATFERMVDKRLEGQRFIPSGQKTDEISTNALGAKVERALGRRMSGQDAVFTRRESNEKIIAVAAQ
ncbi:hypothetical protein K461DRAFT_274878 [Myriangium duriaei CBS 260.36]|uniref:Uncharacterized protein n=1 Tax=Myriangium duriaei CBS 260.36 TaxID=1168546 RepID=A0A9P4J6W8_9PEZI|nr:hypothetical protein K461DRAFT_274878 [Myriangium duriaei CBS 260.36]